MIHSFKFLQAFIILGPMLLVSAQLPVDSIEHQYFYPKKVEELLKIKQLYSENPEQRQNLLYEIGLIYRDISIEDSALYYLSEAYKHQKIQGVVSPKLVLDLHKLVSSRNNYQKDTRKYLEEYANNIDNDSTGLTYANYHLEQALDLILEEGKPELAREELKKIYASKYYRNNPDFKRRMLRFKGYLKNHEGKFEQADKIYRQYLKECTAAQDTMGVFMAWNNIGDNYHDSGNYPEALKAFDSASAIKIPRYQIKTLQILYQNYINALDSLGLKSESKKYTRSRNKIDSLLKFDDQFGFYEIEVKNEIWELKNRITLYEQFISSYRQYKWFYIAGLILTFLLSIYSFFRWKKVDYKKNQLEKQKRKLEAEHKQTVTRIKEMEKVVIKHKITLKNKSVVRLEDLIFIQSEGHFLHLITTKGKEFIRGSLSDIERELPPNFRQCHRSYIVNINCIKSYTSQEIELNNGTFIPISRKYRKNF